MARRSRVKNLGEVLENCGDVMVKGKNPRLMYKGRLTRNLDPEPGHGRRLYAFFFGIPYAMPPVGPRRFKPPEPYKTNATLYEALTSKPESLQIDLKTRETTGSEDCLYLNIYLPKKPKRGQERLPVLVYFHGGAMCRGSGNYDQITPDSIMKEDIILVTVNHRLGVFGFLNMHHETCQGNQGLKDQVMALQWIKDNIEEFGGNSGNVTISGHSAGGSCVNFHLISPLSKGLFHKAIVMSGGIYCPWGYTGHHRELMVKYKRLADSPTTSRTTAVKLMRIENPKHLLIRENQMAEEEKLIPNDTRKVPIYLGPSVENSPECAFIPPCENLQELMDEAEPVPILAGICKKEGYMLREKNVEWIKDREEFIRFLMANLRWYRESAERHVDAIWSKYFPNMSAMSDNDMKESFADFCTDLWFYNFYQNFEFKHNKEKEMSPLFVYLFNFLEDINSAYVYTKEPAGAAHGDIIDFLFCPFVVRAKFRPFSEGVQKKIKTMCQLWASFCKSNNPTSALHEVEWKAHTEEHPCYLYIGNEGVQMQNGKLFQERWDFLTKIITSEQIIPSLPTTPVTPDFDETRYFDYPNSSQGQQGPSNPTKNVTEKYGTN